MIESVAFRYDVDRYGEASAGNTALRPRRRAGALGFGLFVLSAWFRSPVCLVCQGFDLAVVRFGSELSARTLPESFL